MLKRSKSLGLPRTLLGWTRLFWLTLRRCIKCHGPLLRDWGWYDDGETVYCLSCGGLILPRGFFNTLRWNRRALEEKPDAQD